MQACFASYLQACQLLLERGASVLHRSQRGMSVIHYCNRSSVDILHLLVSYGADVNDVDEVHLRISLLSHTYVVWSISVSASGTKRRLVSL